MPGPVCLKTKTLGFCFYRCHSRSRIDGRGCDSVSKGRAVTVINLGGEGEEPGILNQQRPATVGSAWLSSNTGVTLAELAQTNDFLICKNNALPIADDSIDRVYTNSVPIDLIVLGEPGIQSTEIMRILAGGGDWVHDGTVRYKKP